MIVVLVIQLLEKEVELAVPPKIGSLVKFGYVGGDAEYLKLSGAVDSYFSGKVPGWLGSSRGLFNWFGRVVGCSFVDDGCFGRCVSDSALSREDVENWGDKYGDVEVDYDQSFILSDDGKLFFFLDDVLVEDEDCLRVLYYFWLLGFDGDCEAFYNEYDSRNNEIENLDPQFDPQVDAEELRCFIRGLRGV